MGVFAYTRTDFYYPLATVVLSAFAITVVIFQPYKLIIHNAIDSFLILSMIICYSAAMAKIIAQAKTRSDSFLKISAVLIFLALLVPLFYIVVLVVYWLVIRKKLPKKLFQKLVPRNTTEEQKLLKDSLPDRIAHAEAYTQLVPAPISGGEHHSGSESNQGHQHDRDATY